LYHSTLGVRVIKKKKKAHRSQRLYSNPGLKKPFRVWGFESGMSGIGFRVSYGGIGFGDWGGKRIVLINFVDSFFFFCITLKPRVA